jgi:DNA-binding MarR family transcriptional regulator
VTTTPAAPVESWPLSRLLITASRLVEHDIADQLRPYNLTHASFGVLALVQLSPISQRDLAHATRVEEQTISQTVDRLERLGMVTRERDPNDRRRFLITVTGVGRHAFRHATRHDRAEQALEGLPEAEHLRAALAELIRRLGGEGFVPTAEAEH